MGDNDIRPILLNLLNGSRDLKVSQDALGIKAREYFHASDFETQNLLETIGFDVNATFIKADRNGDGFLSYEEIIKLGWIAGDKNQVTKEDLAGLKFTNEHLQFILDNPSSKRAAEIIRYGMKDLDFVMMITPEEGKLDSKLADCIRNNPDSDLALELIKQRWFMLTNDDLEIVKKYPDSKFAIGVAKHDDHFGINFRNDYMEKLKSIAKENPDSALAKELPFNKWFYLTEEDQEFVRKNPNCQFTQAVLIACRGGQYIVAEKDHETARKNPDSNFAQWIDSQPSFKVTKEDKEFVRVNPNCKYANIIAHETYELELEDFKVAYANRNSRFAGNLGQGPNYRTACKKIFGFVPKEYPPPVIDTKIEKR